MTIPIVCGGPTLTLQINSFWTSEELRFPNDVGMELSITPQNGEQTESTLQAVYWSATVARKSHVLGKYIETYDRSTDLSSMSPFEVELKAALFGVPDNKFLKIEAQSPQADTFLSWCPNCFKDSGMPWEEEKIRETANFQAHQLSGNILFTPEKITPEKIVQGDLVGMWGLDSDTFFTTRWSRTSKDGKYTDEAEVLFRFTLLDSNEWYSFKTRQFWPGVALGSYFQSEHLKSGLKVDMLQRVEDVTVCTFQAFSQHSYSNEAYTVFPTVKYKLFAGGKQVDYVDITQGENYSHFSEETLKHGEFQDLTLELFFTNNVDTTKDFTETYTIKINNPPPAELNKVPNRPTFKKYINGEWKKMHYGLP